MDKELVKDGKPILKRKFRDSVFTSLFSDKKYLLELYRALHPDDTDTTEDDIQDVTVRNVLTDSSYNDLGCKIGNTLLLLVEVQVKWTANIIIRILMYLVQTYNQYFTESNADLYSTTKVKLPKPELYMIFLGDRKDRPEYITLSEEFFGGQETAVDVKVKVIYDGQPGDIINQYVLFTRICAEQIKLYGRTRKAVEETIRICRDRNVLKEYLETREKEVIDIMVALFDEQEVFDRYVDNKVKEAEIKSTIEDCQYFDISLLDTIKRVSTKYKLSEDIAEQKVQQYWNV